MTSQVYGNHTKAQAWTVGSGKLRQQPFANNLTRRNVNIIEKMPNRGVSTSLASANIKALRLFRYVCRMIPFILNVHEMNHRFTPIQVKRYVANHFRVHSTMTNLNAIDRKIQEGYENAHEAEWHFNNTGYLSKYINGPKGIFRDRGTDRFQESRGAQNKKSAPSGFLKTFYQGKQEFAKERIYQ